MFVAFGGLLFATAIFGVAGEGASRWIRVAGLSLQISLVVLPAKLVAFARQRDLLATIGMMLAAIAFALQPDRAMSGVLVAALAVLAISRPDRWVVSTLAVAVAGFTTTMIRPDSRPAGVADGIGIKRSILLPQKLGLRDARNFAGCPALAAVYCRCLPS